MGSRRSGSTGYDLPSAVSRRITTGGGTRFRGTDRGSSQRNVHRGCEPEPSVGSGDDGGLRADLLGCALEPVTKIEPLGFHLPGGILQHAPHLGVGNAGDAVGAVEPQLTLWRLDDAGHSPELRPPAGDWTEAVAHERREPELAPDPDVGTAHVDREHVANAKAVFFGEEAHRVAAVSSATRLAV